LKILPQEGQYISLGWAEREGQIATVPLINIIHKDYKQFGYIALLIDLFIMLSVTVSYITLSTGMKHVLDGMIRKWKAVVLHPAPDPQPRLFARCSAHVRKASVWFGNLKVRHKQALYYSLFFGFIFLVAQTNPKSLLILIEFITSLALNLEAGAFIGVMLGTARGPKWRDVKIPCALHETVFRARWFVIFYFLFAVCYDIVSVVVSLAGEV